MSVKTALTDFLKIIGVKEEDTLFRRKGKIAYIPCPFHFEKSASMRITPGISFYCYGCGEHGSSSEEFIEKLKDVIEYRNSLNDTSFIDDISDEIDEIPF